MLRSSRFQSIIDADRWALWGTSISAQVVAGIAACDTGGPLPRAVVLHAPLLAPFPSPLEGWDSLGAAGSRGVFGWFRLAVAVLRDAARARIEFSRQCVPIVSPRRVSLVVSSELDASDYLAMSTGKPLGAWENQSPAYEVWKVRVITAPRPTRSALGESVTVVRLS